MKKVICSLITIGLVISFTSCNSKEVSIVSNQNQQSNKIITSNAPKLAESNSDSIYNPPEQSREELYQDIFISLLVPSIQKSVADYYKTYLTESPIVSPDYIYVLSAERLGGYRAYSFNLKLKVSSYIGPHLNIGDDYITMKVEGAGNITIENFEHVKSYYQDLPSNYQNIIIKKSNDISTNLKTNLIQTDSYTISIPANISVKKELDGEVLNFSINDKTIGGFERVNYYPDKPKSPFEPNHSSLVSSNKITDMNYEVLENKYEMYPPAASGDTTKTNVTHLFFLFKDYAYDLNFDTSAVDDSTILEIGKSFKLK